MNWLEELAINHEVMGSNLDFFFSFSSKFFSYEAIFLVRKKRREEKMRGRKHRRGEGGRGASGGGVGWVGGTRENRRRREKVR